MEAPISSAFIVADEFLRLSKKKGEFLTPMQLLKLTYIAHGWSLAVLNRDLFSDRIEAWKYGPVIPKLYRGTKHFGRNPIPHNMIDDEPLARIDQTVVPFLAKVYEKYGHLSAFQLSMLTHMPGTPWDRVYVEGVQGIEIPDDIIEEHYREKLNEHNRPAA